MTDPISMTTITDFATGRAAPVIALNVGGRTEYASISDAWGKAIADLMDALDRANRRIAELEATAATTAWASILDNAEARADD